MSHQIPVQLPRGRPRSFDMEAAVERAMGVFWSRGYHATALPDLLRATKLSRGSLYAAFGDKHSLFLRALDRYIADALTRMDIELDPHGEPVDGLQAVDRLSMGVEFDIHAGQCIGNVAIERTQEERMLVAESGV